jgi:hypothetical protein
MFNLAFLNTQSRPTDTAHPSTFTVTSQLPSRLTDNARLTREIRPGQRGRLRYQATEWNAQSIDNTYIPVDTIVRPIMRRGNTWFVTAD